MHSCGKLDEPREEARLCVKRGVASSPQPSQLIHRPVAENGFAVNISFLHRPEIAAVVRHAAMISQNKVAARRHDDLGIGALIGVGGRNVVFD